MKSLYKASALLIDAFWCKTFAYNQTVVSRTNLQLDNKLLSQEFALNLASSMILSTS